MVPYPRPPSLELMSIRSALPSLLLGATILLPGCGGDGAPPGGEPTVLFLEGEVVLAGGEAIPPGSRLQVRLVDVTVPLEAPAALSSLSLSDVGGGPVTFQLPYGPEAIRRLRVYGVDARVETPGGESWRTSLPVRVFEADGPDPLVLELQPAPIADWWDPDALDRFTEALDGRQEMLPLRRGSARRGDASSTWEARMEGGFPVTIREELDQGGQGRGVARYHLREGRVFRYEEIGERWVVDLSGEGRVGPVTLLLYFDPDGGVLRGIRTRDGVRVDLPDRDVREVLDHAARLVEAAREG